VLVQTIAPDARAISYAARHDSDGFLEGELQRREALSYPPFSHLIRVVCSAERADRARAAARPCARRFSAQVRGGETVDRDGATVLGPASCFACAAASARCW